MLDHLLSSLAHFVTGVISASGYLGVFLLMAAESANVPIPSEVIMPFSGSLVASGRFELWPVIVVGTLGNLAGSLVSYAIARFGGRPVLDRYGRYLLLSKHHLAVADRWFDRYGIGAVFFGRLLPLVRTFISFPAGIARVAVVEFSLATFIGALPFVTGLTILGKILGEHWESLRPYFRYADFGIIGLVILAILWTIIKKQQSTKA